ncbi:MAG TPA: hypothetical protein EYN66_03555 [Myxococcales bacterium]|nr:hypothetical protein [Myxococcales bacterium]
MVLNKITQDVYWWRALEVERKRHLNGYIFVGPNGLTLVDPPGLPDAVIPEVTPLGKISSVIVTGRFQERRAQHFQRCYSAKLHAPAADQRLIVAKADNYFGPNDQLFGGFEVIALPHQRTPGESVLFHRQSRAIVAGHLSGAPPGFISMRSEKLYHNFSASFQAQLALLDLEFDIILPGLGTPVLTDGRKVLAGFLASYQPAKMR